MSLRDRARRQIQPQLRRDRNTGLRPVAQDQLRWRSEATIDPDRLYSLIRVQQVEFAYTVHDAFVRALGQIWDAGLVPEPLPSATGAQLRDRAPNLAGIDVDLADLKPDDVAPPSASS
jgi:hypothetical protein